MGKEKDKMNEKRGGTGVGHRVQVPLVPFFLSFCMKRFIHNTNKNRVTGLVVTVSGSGSVDR